MSHLLCHLYQIHKYQKRSNVRIRKCPRPLDPIDPIKEIQQNTLRIPCFYCVPKSKARVKDTVANIEQQSLLPPA